MNKAEFENMMEEIDNLLKDKNIPIHARTISALPLISQKIKKTIVMDGEIEFDINSFDEFSIPYHVNNWYNNKYGDKLKFDFRPGSSVLLIKKDPYEVEIPRFITPLNVVYDRDLAKYRRIPPVIISKHKIECNSLNSIKGLTQVIANELSDLELLEIHNYFVNVTKLYNEFLLISKHKFIKEALGDLKQAVGSIVDSQMQLGMSRWSTLQFSEKILKACALKESGKHPFTHLLEEIIPGLKNKEFSKIQKKDIAAIQCSTNVRYDTKSSTLEDAVKAHHSSLNIARIVVNYLSNSEQLNKI
jgi:hypothetical protein